MHLASVNLLAVVAAAIASFALNFLWFTVLFRKPYAAGLGKTQAQMDQGPSMFVASGLQVVGFICMAFALGWLMERLGQSSIKGGVTLAAIVWLSFVASIIIPMHAFQAFPVSFTAITITGYLAALLVSGVIVGFWR